MFFRLLPHQPKRNSELPHLAIPFDPRFFTKKGRLTVYSLRCGYIEIKSCGLIETRLWHEGVCYHVRQNDLETGKRIFWESFPTLTEARNFFNRCPGHIHKPLRNYKYISGLRSPRTNDYIYQILKG